MSTGDLYEDDQNRVTLVSDNQIPLCLPTVNITAHRGFLAVLCILLFEYIDPIVCVDIREIVCLWGEGSNTVTKPCASARHITFALSLIICMYRNLLTYSPSGKLSNGVRWVTLHGGHETFCMLCYI